MGRTKIHSSFQKIIALLPARIRSRMEGSGVLNRFLKLASWTLVAFALDKAAMLVIVFVLARILGAADYGRLTLAQGLVNSAQIFVVLGAGTMLARYIPAMREESIRRAVEVINLCALLVLSAAMVFTVVGFLGAPIIATTVLDVATSSPVPYLIIIWVLLTVVNNLLLTIMLSFEKGSAMGLVSFIAALLSVVTVPLLTLNLGLTGAAAALVGVELAKAALLLTLYRRLLGDSGVAILTPIRWDDTPLLWQFGLPVFLTSALWAPTIWLAQVIIKTRAPDGLIAVGVFGFANNLLGTVILLSGLTNRAALPIQSSLHARGAHSELRRMSSFLALSQAGAAAVIALLVAGMAPFIMASAGADFAPYWPVLVIMIATGVILAGQNALSNYLLVSQGPYFALMTLVPWATIMLGATAVYAQHGAYALAWALFVASIVRTALFCGGWLRTRELRPNATEA